VPVAEGATVTDATLQPGQEALRSVLPEDIVWKPFPPFPPSARLVVVVGQSSVLPGGTAHFHWARSGEYVTQVTGIGPLGLEYVDSQDDPRNVHEGTPVRSC
jgi:hypothetical protein